MGQLQQNMTTLEGARSAAKSVCKDTHDTQAGGIKQSLKQNVTNSKVPEGSSNAHAEGSAGSGCFAQRSTGSKRY